MCNSTTPRRCQSIRPLLSSTSFSTHVPLPMCETVFPARQFAWLVSVQYSPYPYGRSWGVFQELSRWGCGCVYIHVPNEVSSARLTCTLRLGHDIWIEALVDLVEGLVFPVSRHFRCGVDFVEVISPLPVRRERWMKGFAS